MAICWIECSSCYEVSTNTMGDRCPCCGSYDIIFEHEHDLEVIAEARADLGIGSDIGTEEEVSDDSSMDD